MKNKIVEMKAKENCKSHVNLKSIVGFDLSYVRIKVTTSKSQFDGER